MPTRRGSLRTFVALGLALGGSACGTGERQPTVAQVKAAAERYRDVKLAVADGYTTDNKCVTAQMLGFPANQGAMGLHYVRRDLLGLPDVPKGRVSGTGTYTDFARPAMLVYEPQADGSLELVAVENLVFKAAWEAAGNRAPPSFHGTPYLLLVDDPSTTLDEAHGYEPHYELHAWVLRDNPLGTFAPFNPNVTCRHHKAQGAGAPHAPAHSPAVAAVDVDKARALLRAEAVVVDVREPEELKESGWLEGAVNRPMSSFAKRARELPRDRPIILYCRSGRRSAMAGEILAAAGFTRVHDLGGFATAASAGWPVQGP